MNIIQAIKDDRLFRPFLGDDLSSWRHWMTALRCVYGGPVPKLSQRRLIKQCTGRDPSRLPKQGFDTALFLTGRRSGKSRIAAVIGAHEAAIAGHESKLSKGELGIVAVCAPTMRQGNIVKGYLRSIFETTLLANEIANDTREGFDLKSGTRIQVLAGDWRTIRGYTLLAAIIDEACFFGVEDTKVLSDTELVRAIKPSLATVGGKLIAISSPYARRGWSYQTWKKHYGNDEGNALVWNCPSRTMNPQLPQRIVDEALAEDLAAAKSEYLGEWRDDVATFIPRQVIEALIVPGRVALMPSRDCRYVAFADVSGGRADASALSIAHLEERTVVIDYARQWKAPHNPHAIIATMADELKRYGIKRVTGDNYAAEFVASSFTTHGIRYERCDKPASSLYLELLPRLCSGEIELPDDELLTNQLASLERRTRSGGKDQITHPANGHDDLANAVAGAAVCAVARRITVGAL